jgi:DNA-binding MurR/RpiR family transcriptional regulator
MNFEKSPEFKEKIRQTLTGKKHTSERKENQRKSHLGKKLTEETKQKLKEYYKHNPQKWKGTKLSDEQKIKLSISHTGKTGILSSNKKSVIKILGNEKIEYFSIADAAKHHNVHPATITKYIKNKTMPKDGASWYYKKDLK